MEQMVMWQMQQLLMRWYESMSYSKDFRFQRINRLIDDGTEAEWLYKSTLDWNTADIAKAKLTTELISQLHVPGYEITAEMLTSRALPQWKLKGVTNGNNKLEL